MATKIAPATIDQSPPVVLNQSTDKEWLKSQKRHIDQQLKEIAAAEKSNPQERLAKEIEKQELSPNGSLTYDMFAYVNRRVVPGQSPEDAKEAVLAICARLIDEGLEKGNPWKLAQARKASK